VNEKTGKSLLMATDSGVLEGIFRFFPGVHDRFVAGKPPDIFVKASEFIAHFNKGAGIIYRGNNLQAISDYSLIGQKLIANFFVFLISLSSSIPPEPLPEQAIRTAFDRHEAARRTGVS